MTSYYARVSVAIYIHVALSYTSLVTKAYALYLVRASEGFRVEYTGSTLSVVVFYGVVYCDPMHMCPAMCFLKENLYTYLRPYIYIYIPFFKLYRMWFGG